MQQSSWCSKHTFLAQKPHREGEVNNSERPITEQREIQISELPLASNDSEHRLNSS